jgi:hypothetical protein
MNYTIRIAESWMEYNEIRPVHYETMGKINSLNFKKGTMRVSYKNRFGKRRTEDFPISAFFSVYSVDKV